MEFAKVLRRDKYGMGSTLLETTRTIERVLFTFAGIALYNMLELFLRIVLRFKAWSGLYFWSLIFATFGLLPYTLGLLFKFFGVIHGYPLVYTSIAMIDVGWQLMVTGQSMVLYSRLHLVCQNLKVRRWCLWMIIGNWFISNVPTTVFVFGAASPQAAHYTVPYGVWERLQLALYFAQETVLSSIYVYEVMQMLKPELFDKWRTAHLHALDRIRHILSVRTKQTNTTKAADEMTSTTFGKRMRSESSKRVLRHLVWINIFIITLDASLLVTEYIGHYEVQVLYKAIVYSTKLKMEFSILNQLTDIAQERLRSSNAAFSDSTTVGADSAWDPLATERTRVGSFASPWEQRKESLPGMSMPILPLRDPTAAVGCAIGVLPDVEGEEVEVEGRGGERRMAPLLLTPIVEVVTLGVGGRQLGFMEGDKEMNGMIESVSSAEIR